MDHQSIAHYTITGKLGEGAMGEVYRATDTRLNRGVAIKMLSPRFAADPEVVSRLRREAEVLASLNHATVRGAHCGSASSAHPW